MNIRGAQVTPLDFQPPTEAAPQKEAEALSSIAELAIQTVTSGDQGQPIPSVSLLHF